MKGGAVIAAVVVCATGVVPLSAQSRGGGAAPVPACDRPFYQISCAMQAAGITALRQVVLGKDDREIRYWMTSGYFFPDEVLILRQRGDSVTGRLVYFWAPGMLEQAFAQSRCREQEQWSTPAGGACVARLTSPIYWRAMVRDLDEAGLSMVPFAPVRTKWCDRTPIPPPPDDPDRLPIDRLCPMRFDGFDEVIEVKRATGYWRYQFPDFPAPMDIGLQRDKALREIFRRTNQR